MLIDIKFNSDIFGGPQALPGGAKPLSTDRVFGFTLRSWKAPKVVFVQLVNKFV